MEYEDTRNGCVRVQVLRRERYEKCMIKILSDSSELVWID